MILPAREYRRVANRFFREGSLHSLEGGGMRVTMDGANFSYTHIAHWHDDPDRPDKKDFIANDTLKARKWQVHLLDTTDGDKGRLLTEVLVTGDREQARRDLRLFLNFVYL